MLKTLFLSLLLVFTLVSPLYADYCQVGQDKYPCAVFVFIYAPDGKTIFWVVKINPDGSKEVIYEHEGKKDGLKEATKEELESSETH